MLQNLAWEFKKLESYDFRVLQGVENAMRFFDWVPVDELPSYCRLTKEEVNYRVGRLLRFKLVQRRTTHYVGYKLTIAGLDALAIRTLVKREAIQALGSKIGVGKESDVYDAKRDKGMTVIVKFHREGTTFRHVKRSRGYNAHTKRYSWNLAAKLAAAREYQALEKLHSMVAVPKPIAQDRHVVVMELIEGRELSRINLTDPLEVLQKIIVQIKLAYNQKVVHGDLSEYNVLVCSDGHIAIIDWPQWVPLSHPNSNELLRRDVSNVLSYFARKYKITKRTEDIMSYISQDIHEPSQSPLN